jgi:hypothetical protein
MLTEHERSHIRAEEVFRQEVRRDLEASKKSKSSSGELFRALNTPFVIWVLSTLVIGFFGWSFSAVQASHAAHLAAAESVRKLDIEISHRLVEASDALSGLEMRIRSGGYSYSDSAIFAVPLLRIDVMGNETEDTIYPEYRQRKFPSLVAELQRLVSGQEREQIERSLEAYRVLKKNVSGGDQSYSSGGSKRSQDEIIQMMSVASTAEQLINQIACQRWKQF